MWKGLVREGGRKEGGRREEGKRGGGGVGQGDGELAVCVEGGRWEGRRVSSLHAKYIYRVQFLFLQTERRDNMRRKGRRKSWKLQDKPIRHMV